MTHTVTQAAAQSAELPSEKVVMSQYSGNSLTFVSGSLYAFFCRLELIYWYNLNLRQKVHLTADTMRRLETFCRTDKGVTRAWRRCMYDIVVRHSPALLAANTWAGLSELNKAVTEATLRSRFVFNLFLRTYRNVRGKEFCAAHAEQNRIAGDIRQSQTRDKLAARVRVTAEQGEGGASK